MRRERLVVLAQRHGALVLLMALLAYGQMHYDWFLSIDHLTGLATHASILAIVAVGLTLVVVTGGIDLSVGSVYATGCVLGAYAAQWGALAGLLVPLAAGALIGATQGWLIGAKKLAPFIVTLGGLLFARGFAKFVTQEGQTHHAVPRESLFLGLGEGLVPFALAVIVSVAAGLVLHRTPFGLKLTAIGGAEDTSGLMGVPVARTKIIVYTLSSVLAALAGAITAAQLGSGPSGVGVGLELEAIAAVVIGGTVLCGGAGTITGTLSGVALLWVIRDFVDHTGGVSPDIQAVISGGLLIVIVVAQALLGRARRGHAKAQ